jgi:hypothetical protein
MIHIVVELKDLKTTLREISSSMLGSIGSTLPVVSQNTSSSFASGKILTPCIR